MPYAVWDFLKSLLNLITYSGLVETVVVGLIVWIVGNMLIDWWNK